MAVSTYDPAQISVIVGGKILSGFADDTFVTVSRNNDMWVMKTGADGSTTRVKTNDKSGMIVVTLQQASPSNDDLSALLAADELSNTGVVPVFVRDASGRSLHSALTAWVQRYPQVDYSKDVTNRSYSIATDSLECFVGGN